MINKRALDAETKDIITRESFNRINQSFDNMSLNKGNFEFFTFTFSNTTGGVLNLTDVLIPHGLKFVPKDVIQTSMIGDAWVWKHDKFTLTDLVVSVQIAANSTTSVRAFIGRYEEGTVNG
jgi:hypothetical protein